MKLFRTIVKDEVTEMDRTAKRRRIHRQMLRHPDMRRILKRLDAIPSLDEVEYMAVFQGYSADPACQTVSFQVTLKEEVKDPQFARDLVRSGIARRLTKRVSYGGSSLQISGDLFPDLVLAFSVSITINGYVPATCKIIYEEVEIPARTEKRAKVVCGGANELDASAEGTDLEEELVV